MESVKLLASLKPSVVITNHGQPLRDKELSEQLQNLADNFDKLAVQD